MQDQIVPAVAVVLALLALVLAAVVLYGRSHTAAALLQARAQTAALQARLEALEHRLERGAPEPGPVSAEFVITDLTGDPQTGPPVSGAPPEVGSALFADLVLRETVVKAASLAHGVRRALDPETRNRIRFEMRREVKRARKQRRLDGREARRGWEARQRAAGREDPAA